MPTLYPSITARTFMREASLSRPSALPNAACLRARHQNTRPPASMVQALTI